jgi:hypothetical protein
MNRRDGQRIHGAYTGPDTIPSWPDACDPALESHVGVGDFHAMNQPRSIAGILFDARGSGDHVVNISIPDTNTFSGNVDLRITPEASPGLVNVDACVSNWDRTARIPLVHGRI